MKLLGQRGARQIEMFVSRGGACAHPQGVGYNVSVTTVSSLHLGHLPMCAGGLVGVCAGAYTFSSRGLTLVPVRRSVSVQDCAAASLICIRTNPCLHANIYQRQALPSGPRIYGSPLHSSGSIGVLNVWEGVAVPLIVRGFCLSINA